jgi:DNA polymerase III delta prime subunit
VHIEHVQSAPDDGAPPQTGEITVVEAFQHYACLYINYMRIFDRLEKCYDSMVHPQKRIDVKLSLELVIRRVCELKHMLVKWNLPNPDVRVEPGAVQPHFPWEYVNLDDILQDLKLPPMTMEVPVPRYFKEDNLRSLKHRDKIVAGYMKLKLGLESVPVEESTGAGEGVASLEMSWEAAVEAIQRNERGRQGKQRANFVKDMRDDDKRKKNYQDSSTTEMDPEIAAANIQRLFRGYFSRAKAHRERDEELIFIGMKPRKYNNDELENDLLQAYRKRKQEQIDNKEAYEKALEDLNQVVLEEEGPEMKDKLREERTKWVTKYISDTCNIPETLELFYNPPDPEAEAAEAAAAAAAKDKKGGKDDKKKDDKKKDAKKKGEVEVKAIEKPSLDGMSELTMDMKGLTEEYEGVWDGRDESGNFVQKHDPELAKERITRKKVEEVLRKQVDDMLMMSLTKIQPPAKKGKKDKKKGKKDKKKKDKGKKEKPLPGAKIADLKNMDTEHMLCKLVEYKIVNNVEDTYIKDFIGDFNYLGTVHQGQARKDLKRWLPQNPSMAQLRASMTEYGVLPLGSVNIKNKVLDENNVRSLMLYGPAGSGKTMMAQAVANELGALFINLSPNRLNAVGVEGKQGPLKLIHMAFMVAKDPAFAPVVIYVDNALDFFQAGGKKKAKGAGANPMAKFQKDLMIYKNQALKLEDRVIIIGTSKLTEDNAGKDLAKIDFKTLKWNGGKGKPEKQGFYEKFLYFPYPDYPDRVLLWTHFIKTLLNNAASQQGQASISSKVGVPDGFDISSLAHITEGFSAGAIFNAIRSTLTTRRVQSLEKRPLMENEFINTLARQEITYTQDNDVYTKFTCKITDLDKRKKELEDAKKVAEGGGDGKDKKGGGKKK